jgi:hypothetical protein
MNLEKVTVIQFLCSFQPYFPNRRKKDFAPSVNDVHKYDKGGKCGTLPVFFSGKGV